MLSILRFFVCSLVISVVTLANTGFAEEGKKRIQDNSFLIEEAYNQEDGVVQHIQTFQYLKESKSWGYTFVQEWPAPKQLHQLSYTIPINHTDTPTETGIGDVALNYRYQLIFKDAIALAPRFSFILPTGDHKKGMGSGTVGYQANIPLSIELNDKWVTHWNMGFTITPGASGESGGKADTLNFNFGTSFIYTVTDKFNLMLEAVSNSNEVVQPDNSTVREDSFFINPGMRFAVDYESGLQVVPGLAFPIGVGPSKDEYGVFVYLSFEHPLF